VANLLESVNDAESNLGLMFRGTVRLEDSEGKVVAVVTFNGLDETGVVTPE